ncbi:MAG: hypothetical protein ACLU4J_10285 [Butyricimonas paravirosa]
MKKDIYAIRDSLLDWLKEHRHGVMGTVIFHLVCYLFGLCRNFTFGFATEDGNRD